MKGSIQIFNVISEKFIQESERKLLKNPYKLDKQVAALEQMVHEAEHGAKRIRLEVIISTFVNYLELIIGLA